MIGVNPRPDSSICVLSFDLQQQMYLPSQTHTEMYYSRRLACINMGIHLEQWSANIFPKEPNMNIKKNLKKMGAKSVLQIFILNTNKHYWLKIVNKRSFLTILIKRIIPEI